MKLLTKYLQESCENPKICCICIRKFENKYFKDKKYCKVRDHCHYTGEYRGAVQSICNLKYTVPKKFPEFFTVDLTMTIFLSFYQELAEQFIQQFTSIE